MNYHVEKKFGWKKKSKFHPKQIKVIKKFSITPLHLCYFHRDGEAV